MNSEPCDGGAGYIPRCHRGQAGAVSVLALMMLASVVVTSLIFAINISNSSLNDSLNQSDSVAALFLAESGLENALQRLSDGSGLTLCDNSLQDSQALGKGSFTIAGGQLTDFDSVTPLPANQCRIQVTGATSGANVNASRTIQAIANIGGGGISVGVSSVANSNNTNNLVWNQNVSGTNRALLVGVSFRNNGGQTVSSVTYAGVPLSLVVAQSNGNSIRVELWRLVAPATGNNTVAVSVSGNVRIVGGAVSFTGVDQVVPIEAATSGTGNSANPNVNITTLSPNAWVMDVQGEQNYTFGLFAPIAGAAQTQHWNTLSSTCGGFCLRVRGSGSTSGPLVVPGVVNMNWSWFFLSRPWAITAAAIRPASSGSTGVVSWREMVN